MSREGSESRSENLAAADTFTFGSETSMDLETSISKFRRVLPCEIAIIMGADT